jgi:hypothetical protein
LANLGQTLGFEIPQQNCRPIVLAQARQGIIQARHCLFPSFFGHHTRTARFHRSLLTTSAARFALEHITRNEAGSAIKPSGENRVFGEPGRLASQQNENRLRHILRQMSIIHAPTSGAVRATAVEAKSFGHKAAVAEDATGDEASLLHKIALFDIAHKYADVMSLEELLLELRTSSNSR